MSTIQGWFYMHVNGDLIFKNDPDAIEDIRESDLCHTAWPWAGEHRGEAWSMLVEAKSIGANPERIEKLANDWGLNDKDAQNYADYLGIDIGEDGSSKYARLKNFDNLQESPSGFGDTYLDAISALCKELGYKGGKMWNTTFEDLVKQKGA